jgi:hypothetical protein
MVTAPFFRKCEWQRAGRETLQAQDEVELAKKDKAHVVALTVQPAAGQ